MMRINILLKKIIALIFVLPLYLVAFLFSRGSLRVGYIPSQTISRIALMLRNLSGADKKSLRWLIWFNDNCISNKVIANAIKQYVHVYPASLVKPLYDLFWKLKLDNFLVHDNEINSHDEKESKLSIHQILSSSEIEYCQEQLRINLKDCERRLAILCVRDNLYDSLFRSDSIAFQLNHRNSDIQTFLELVQFLISEDYNVIRIGRHVRERANFQSEFYWDYATSNIQSDLLDVYFFSIAKLCVSTRYGVDDLATLFRVPLFLFDHAEDLMCKDALFVHPKLFFRGEKRILSMDEINFLKISDFRTALDFEKVGVCFKSNTPKVLKNAMKEGLSLLRSGQLNSTQISTEWKKLVNDG